MRTLNNKVYDLERIKIYTRLFNRPRKIIKTNVLNYNFNELIRYFLVKAATYGIFNYIHRQNYRGKIKYVLKTLKILNNGDIFQNSMKKLFVNKQKIGV